MPRDRFKREAEFRIRSAIQFNEFDKWLGHSCVRINPKRKEPIRVKCSSCGNLTELPVTRGEYFACVSLKNLVNEIIPVCSSCGGKYSYDLV